MKRVTLVSMVAASFLLLASPVAAAAIDLYNNTNVDGVSNGPTGKTAFGLTCNAHITQIVTYHWNNGRGATPGTISIQDNLHPKTYGPFKVASSSGQGGAPNVNWVADVSLDLPGGKGPTGFPTSSYIVLDSDPATWSMNAKSGYRGFAIIRGECAGGAPSAGGAAGGPPALKTPAPPIVPIVKGIVPKLTPAPAAKPPFSKFAGLPTPKPAAKPTAKPTPAPPPNPLAAIPACFTNSGAVANVGPCFGAPGSKLAVRILQPARGPFAGLQFRATVAGGVFSVVDAPLTGSGALLGATVPTKLCIGPSPLKWDVWLIGGTAAKQTLLGVIGQFSVSGCSSVTSSKGMLPTPVPGTPPPGLASVKPCYTNSGAVANVGPCFGPANSLLAVHILNPKYGPYTLLQFQTVVVNGVPSLVTSPLIGSGSLLSAKVPIQLCLAKSPNKWQVWIYNQTKSAGQIGEFTITGCP